MYPREVTLPSTGLTWPPCRGSDALEVMSTVMVMKTESGGVRGRLSFQHHSLGPLVVRETLCQAGLRPGRVPLVQTRGQFRGGARLT